MSNERATTALQAVHDSLQQTTVIAQRRSQNSFRTIYVKNKGRRCLRGDGALIQPRERQEEARRLHEQICDEVAVAETMNNGAIENTLQKPEALERRVKTVIIRA